MKLFEIAGGYLTFTEFLKDGDVVDTSECPMVYYAAAKWQPIDTAPKDGTDLLLFCREDYRPAGQLCEYMEVGSWGLSYFDVMSWISDAASPLTPTHWMPLPGAPK